MSTDYATDPRLRRFCRDHGLSPGAIRQLAGLVDALVAEQGVHTGGTAGVLDGLGASAIDAPLADSNGPEAERYEDLGRIGAGATGDVRRVHDRRMGRTLAMKVLHRALLPHASALARFRREAALTATLHHPGVVVVHDQGTFPDGRPWFTMQEVLGTTFRAVLGEWTLHRRMDAFARACQTVAYAHSRGILHRDLKPDNVMVGAFGVVQVMDWGLACRVGEADAADSGVGGSGSSRAPEGERLTRVGAVLGTPGYLPPEMAAGLTRGSQEADVYALGAILYHLLSGRPPHATGGPEPWRRVLEGGPPPLVDVPAELDELCGRAMARAPEARPRAEALAEEALAWLDGARRRDQAAALLERTVERLPALDALQEAGAAAKREAEEARRSAAPEERRRGWVREQESGDLSRAGALAEAEIERELHAALNLDPEAAAIHARLADVYQDRMRRAEGRGDVDGASMSEVLLRAHDRGRHARWLSGEGALCLRTAPAGARVTLHPWVEHDRRLVPGPAHVLGTTPLVDVPVPHGSHLLLVEAPGHATMRLPIVLPRLGRWDGEEVLPLLPGELAEGCCYVPAGWFVCGGDPDAADSLPPRRLWVDGFVIGRFPVTHGEWLAFVNAEDRAGHDVEPLIPRTKGDLRPIYRRVAHGWEAGPEDHGGIWPADLPITQITWLAARRYCAAQPPLLGARWRLPDEVEWEKAARGVDGRPWPWGRHFEPAEINMVAAPREPSRASVHGFPDDESLYGVRGLAGNVRDLCANAWSADGGLPADGRLLPREAGPDAARIVLRGGSWYSATSFCRPANRLVARPEDRITGVGFRMVASIRRPATPG
jgi:formylglycine-generating enzyme required for sulfatase activity